MDIRMVFFRSEEELSFFTDLTPAARFPEIVNRCFKCLPAVFVEKNKFPLTGSAGYFHNLKAGSYDISNITIMKGKQLYGKEKNHHLDQST